ncbi:MAG: sensor domain-containing diguanylate cyclase [Spirochaetes bacterium]|jgi:diguanylate cyclase (GGDEF)-like protein|nr:sensor domain-containing diguanylate cyclase [Spirochaetota bacterium]
MKENKKTTAKKPGNSTKAKNPLVNENKILRLEAEQIRLRDRISGLRSKITELAPERDRGERMRMLVDINTYITNSLDKTEVLKRILDQIKKLLECEMSSILLVDDEAGGLKFAYLSKEEDEERLKDSCLKMGEGIAGTVWANGSPIVINDAQSDSRFYGLADKTTNMVTRTLLAVPLTVDGRIIGVIEAINKTTGCFTGFDLQLLQYVSTQSAIAIKNADLYDMAIRDGMTRLFIHKYFRKRLEEEWKRALRYGKNLSLVMFDIDRFKTINDTYGHRGGDRVIKEIADRIMANCREIDIPCRCGGEEFAVILPETRNSEAIVFAERVRGSVENARILLDDAELSVTVSCGVASVPDLAPEGSDELIGMADTALYESKNGGRNMVSLYHTSDKGPSGKQGR